MGHQLLPQNRGSPPDPIPMIQISELKAALERAEHRLKLAQKKVAEFHRDNDPTLSL